MLSDSDGGAVPLLLRMTQGGTFSVLFCVKGLRVSVWRSVGLFVFWLPQIPCICVRLLCFVGVCYMRACMVIILFLTAPLRFCPRIPIGRCQSNRVRFPASTIADRFSEHAMCTSLVILT